MSHPRLCLARYLLWTQLPLLPAVPAPAMLAQDDIIEGVRLTLGADTVAYLFCPFCRATADTAALFLLLLLCGKEVGTDGLEHPIHDAIRPLSTLLFVPFHISTVGVRQPPQKVHDLDNQAAIHAKRERARLLFIVGSDPPHHRLRKGVPGWARGIRSMVEQVVHDTISQIGSRHSRKVGSIRAYGREHRGHRLCPRCCDEEECVFIAVVLSSLVVVCVTRCTRSRTWCIRVSECTMLRVGTYHGGGSHRLCYCTYRDGQSCGIVLAQFCRKHVRFLRIGFLKEVLIGHEGFLSSVSLSSSCLCGGGGGGEEIERMIHAIGGLEMMEGNPCLP